jgi:hypothetical protein
MKAWPVSDRVGNVRNDDATLLEPAQEKEQSDAQGQLFGGG